MPTALIILADGFEEIEAVAVIDILRRAQVEVTVAGLARRIVKGAHQLTVEAETLLVDMAQHEFDCIILPGGEPGTTNLQKSALLVSVLKKQVTRKGYIAAICAAPRVLDNLGLLQGHHATSYPGTRPDMIHCTYLENPVVADDRIITSRGPGTAMAFAYVLVEVLVSREKADELKQVMLFMN